MDKKVIVIGAVSQDGVYGIGNKIPWRIPEEMAHFKEQTLYNTVIMGRGTWESLPEKFRPLPERDNFVISNTPGYVAEGARVLSSIEQAIDAAKTDRVFCIGGHDIWYHAMSLADEAIISEISKDFWENQSDVRMAPELLSVSIIWPKFRRMSSIEVEGKIPFTLHRWLTRDRY